MFIRNLFAAGLVLASGLGLPQTADARGWQRHHPARAQINHRIHRQQVRITHQVRQGDITRQEAHGLRQDVHQVRVQERTYAQQNGNNGHLTRAQTRALNRQLNHTGHAIGH
jgi:hypothetical protein